jgi:hypothetical protein
MAKPTFLDPRLVGRGLDPLSPAGVGSTGRGGSQGSGIGGGGGSPGGGTPGGGGSPGGGTPGGGGGGRPGETTAGNNLSVPAIFPETAPDLRGTEGSFTFTTPTYLTGDTNYVYFAQGVEGNEWQAGNISVGATAAAPIAINYVNIGDALESAPIQKGRNVRLELTLWETITDITDSDGDDGDIGDDTLSGFAMTLLGGSKGKGKPGTTGPTESQGARYPYASPWTTLTDGTVSDTTDGQGITYDSTYASVYAANASSTGEGETVDSYMTLVIQKVEGLTPQYIGQGGDDFITGLGWDGTQWVDTNSGDSITVGKNLSTTAFGPELTISGTYNVGASGSPWKFTADGTYLITFALKNGTPVMFDANTQVLNDDPLLPGFQPTELTAGRYTQVVADNTLGVAVDGGGFVQADTHNGLLAMLVGVPSRLPTGGGETGLAVLM